MRIHECARAAAAATLDAMRNQGYKNSRKVICNTKKHTRSRFLVRYCDGGDTSFEKFAVILVDECIIIGVSECVRVLESLGM